MKKRLFWGTTIAAIPMVAVGAASAAITVGAVVSLTGIVSGVLLGGGYVVWKSVRQSRKAIDSRLVKAVGRDEKNGFLATQAVLNAVPDPIDGAHLLDKIITRDRTLYNRLNNAIETQDRKNVWKLKHDILEAVNLGLKNQIDAIPAARTEIETEAKKILSAFDDIGGLQKIVEKIKEVGGIGIFIDKLLTADMPELEKEIIRINELIGAVAESLERAQGKTSAPAAETSEEETHTGAPQPAADAGASSTAKKPEEDLDNRDAAMIVAASGDNTGQVTPLNEDELTGDDVAERMTSIFQDNKKRNATGRGPAGQLEGKGSGVPDRTVEENFGKKVGKKV